MWWGKLPPWWHEWQQTNLCVLSALETRQSEILATGKMLLEGDQTLPQRASSWYMLCPESNDFSIYYISQFSCYAQKQKTESLILNLQYCTANVDCLLLPLASYLQVCLSMYSIKPCYCLAWPWSCPCCKINQNAAFLFLYT